MIWNQSVVPCPVLTVASWSAYSFLRRQVRWSGIPISWRTFYILLWSTQSKALVWSIKQMFFWKSLSFLMIQRMLAIWSLLPLPFLNPAWISASSRFTYYWSLARRIVSITLTPYVLCCMPGVTCDGFYCGKTRLISACTELLDMYYHRFKGLKVGSIHYFFCL